MYSLALRFVTLVNIEEISTDNYLILRPFKQNNLIFILFDFKDKVKKT